MKTGVKIAEQSIKDLLYSSGAKIEGDRVLFSSIMLEEALEKAPAEITLYGLDGSPRLNLENSGNTYFGTHADMMEIIDFTSGEVRDFTRSDSTLMVKLAEEMDNIDFILAVGLAADIPRRIQSQLALIDTLRGFSKTINFSSNDLQGLNDQLEIISLAADGMDKFRARPFAFYYCEPLPPLHHPDESLNKLRLAVEEGVPVVYMPYCMMGATAPMSFASTLVQCNAEILSGLVVSQLTIEGAPFIYGAMPSIFDMRTTIGSYGAPEFHLLVAAASEMAAYYGLPFYGTGGCSDAKYIDEQALIETTMSIFSSLLSPAQLVHDVGIMDHCSSLAPEMVVIINEMIDMLKAYCQKINVDRDEIDLELIDEVGPGGHYVEHEHTLNNFKRIWYPRLFARKMSGAGRDELRKRVCDQLEEIEKKESVSQLTEEQLGELDNLEDKLFQKL